MAEKPKMSNSASQREIDKVEVQFEKFDQEVKSMTLDRMSSAPKDESSEQQTKMSQREAQRAKEITLKPDRFLSDNQKFNEKFREDWEFDKQYVNFIAEHKEIQGDTIEMWTHPYGGKGAEFWKIPSGKPVWGPRYLAEQIKKCSYHRLKMQEERIQSQDHMGTWTGTLTVDTTVQRMDAYPVGQKRSVFV